MATRPLSGSLSPFVDRVVVEGVGLHTGAPARVVVSRGPGPVRFVANGWEARIDELEVVSTARATTVSACGGRLRVQTVEHAMSALAAHGLYEGIAVAVDGPELPLLDGGAVRWCEAVRSLGVAPAAPRLRVAREGSFQMGPSRYEWAPSAGLGVDVEVEIDFADPRLAPRARWKGDADDFRARVAPARTFARAREVDELLRRGLVRHVDPESVVLLAADAVHHAGRSFSADEPARHKLLDLVGDLYVHGGPPIGRTRAFRPGHAANLRAVLQALERGVLVARGR